MTGAFNMTVKLQDETTALMQLASALRALGYHFVTITPASHERVNHRPGNEWARNLTDVFGWSRPFHADVVPSDIFALMHLADVVVPESGGWRSLVRASTLAGELFLHSAFPTTAPDAVFLGPDSYRFACAILQHLERIPAPRRAVDIGCGAGVGAVLVARAFPGAEVLAGDINAEALRLTRINAAVTSAVNVRVRASSLLDDIEGRFDLIIANPPYLADGGKRLYRDGGGRLGDGLSLAIVDVALERLAPGGSLLLYTGVAITYGLDGFRNAVAERLAGTGFSCAYREVDPDVFGEELERPVYAHADRIAAVVLTITRPA